METGPRITVELGYDELRLISDALTTSSTGQAREGYTGLSRAAGRLCDRFDGLAVELTGMAANGRWDARCGHETSGGGTVRTIELGLHTAYLCPMTGVGALVLPSPADDVRSPVELAGSLLEADWNAALRELDGLGWEPLEDESDGGWIEEGETVQGRTMIALYGREPITTMPTLEEVATARAEIARLAGLAD